jgi:hypothetical protein
MKNKTIFVNGAPKIIMPHEIFQECLGWMLATRSEVSWRGLADWNQEEFRVTEIFLPIQNAEMAYVRVPTAKDGGGDFSKWLTDCLRKGTYQNKQGDCRYKLHMHKHPGDDWGALGESGTDDRNTARFGLRSIDWMMVGRAIDSGRFRIDLEIFSPFQARLENLPVFTEYGGELFCVSEPGTRPEMTEVNFASIPVRLLSRIKENQGQPIFGQVTVREKERIWYESNFWPQGTAIYSGGIQPLFQQYQYLPQLSTKKIKKKKVTTREAEIVLAAIVKEPPADEPYFRLQKRKGFIFGSFFFPAGPWQISTDELRLGIDLPMDPGIHEQARRLVQAKVKRQEDSPAAAESRRPRAKTVGNFVGGKKGGGWKHGISPF